MSKRSEEKRVTKATRAIKFLRDQANMSLREAARASGLNLSVVAHLETGRIGVGENHLKLLLPVYGATLRTFQMFAQGDIDLPPDPKRDCLELVQRMTRDQLRTALPVLQSLANQR